MIKIEWKSCLRLGVTALAVFLCIHYWKAGTGFVLAVVGALAALIAGGVIAFIVNILMSFLERHYFQKSKKKLAGKSRRPVCMVTAYLLVIALLVLVVALVVPELVQCIKILIDRLPEALEKLSENETVAQYLPVVTEKLAEADWDAMIAQVQEFVKVNAGGVAGNVTSAVSTVFSSIVTFVIGIIFSIYLLSGKEKLGAQCTALMTRYLKPGVKAKIQSVLAILNRNFHKYIVGQCTEALILGVLCTLGMLVFRFPYALMIGVLTGTLQLIPVVGGLIGGVIGALMMLTVSPMKALMFLVFIVILQQLESNLVYPKVVGNAIGLPALWVLAAVTLGGGIGGVVGMLTAVPLMATVYQLVRNDVKKPKPGEDLRTKPVQKQEGA